MGLPGQWGAHPAWWAKGIPLAWCLLVVGGGCPCANVPAPTEHLSRQCRDGFPQRAAPHRDQGRAAGPQAAEGAGELRLEHHCPQGERQGLRGCPALSRPALPCPALPRHPPASSLTHLPTSPPRRARLTSSSTPRRRHWTTCGRSTMRDSRAALAGTDQPHPSPPGCKPRWSPSLRQTEVATQRLADPGLGLGARTEHPWPQGLGSGSPSLPGERV